MKFLFVFIFLTFSVMADTTLQTRITSIDWGRHPNEDVLLLLETGHVAKIKRNKIALSKEWKSTMWEISFDKARFVTSLKELEKRSFIPLITDSPTKEFVPTVVKNNAARTYFKESRISRGDTQCYNRAQVWAYELWKRHKVKTQKIFLFFSRKYIRNNNFGWWFHVAPLMSVEDWAGVVTEKVIDPRFITAPRSIDWWTEKFVGNTYCKDISKYSDYADYPYSEDCYIYKTSMYVYQPLDLEMQEVWGMEKIDFVRSDLEWAYREAFQMTYQEKEL